MLLNCLASMVISAPNDNAAVVLTHHIDMNRGTWRFQGVDHGALQLQANTDMNLNGAGDGPYPSGAAVLAWDWSSGAPNKVLNVLRVGV